MTGVEIARNIFKIAHIDYAISSLTQLIAITEGEELATVINMVAKLEGIRENIAGQTNDMLGGEAIE